MFYRYHSRNVHQLRVGPPCPTVLPRSLNRVRLGNSTVLFAAHPREGRRMSFPHSLPESLPPGIVSGLAAKVAFLLCMVPQKEQVGTLDSLSSANTIQCRCTVSAREAKSTVAPSLLDFYGHHTQTLQQTLHTPVPLPPGISPLWLCLGGIICVPQPRNTTAKTAGTVGSSHPEITTSYRAQKRASVLEPSGQQLSDCIQTKHALGPLMSPGSAFIRTQNPPGRVRTEDQCCVYRTRIASEVDRAVTLEEVASNMALFNCN